ncbi:hypothetical protein [Paenibacillus taichungensis]
MKTNKTVNEWIKLGYTAEQSEELVKHSGNDLIDVIKGYGKVIDSTNE